MYTRTYDKTLKKMVYLQNRRFLPTSDALRRSTTFPNNRSETRLSPPKRIAAEVQQFQEAFDKAKNKCVL